MEDFIKLADIPQDELDDFPLNQYKKRPLSQSYSSSLSSSSDPAPKRPLQRNEITRIDPIKYARYNDAPWIKGKSYSSDPIKRLHEEILDFISYVSPSPEEHQARHQVIQLIQSTVLKKFPHSIVKIFGSYETKLYLPNADLDLVVICENNPTRSASALRKIARLLVQDGIAIESTVIVITKARVPIIKFIDSRFHFEVDVSFNISSGIESAEIVKALVDVIPSIKPLTLLVKQFLSIRKLNEVYMGGLGSYSIALLIVSFLQMHPLIQSNLIKAEDNFGVLLVEFFELYGKLFNYENVGISLRNGGFYFDKLQRGWGNVERMMLCLEDPQNESNDVAKCSYAMSSVKQAFDHSFSMLTSVIKELDARYQEDKPLPRSDSYSILSSVLYVEKDVIKHREFVKAKMNDKSSFFKE